MRRIRHRPGTSAWDRGRDAETSKPFQEEGEDARAADRIENGREIGGTRTLSGVIAHETTYILVADELGEVQAMALPTWKQEGYADHVAQESSLTLDQYRMIARGGNGHPAADYYEGRLRVEEALAANGGDVDALLRGP